MDVKDRLLSYLAYKKIGQNAFEKRAGISNGYINKVKGSIGSTIITKIVDASSDLNRDWLLYGEGEMLKNTEDVEFCITEDMGTPVYDIDATCGLLSRSFEDEKIIGYVNLPDIKKDSHIITACGDSMEPRIMNGDKIVLREIISWSYFYFGQIYLVLTEDYRMLKYVRKHKDENYIILKSENKSYDDIELKKSQILKLFVVENVLSIKNMM